MSDVKQSTATDWNQVLQRLEADPMKLEVSLKRLKSGSNLTNLKGSRLSLENLENLEKERKILRARARALARKPELESEVESERLEVLEFLLAHERYGLESHHVREVYLLKELTPLPGTPPFVLGIVNIRGQILSVIDLKKFFELPEKGLTDLNRVIVLYQPNTNNNNNNNNNNMEFGLLADQILGVRTIPLKDIQPSLPTLIGIRERYLKGIAKEQLVILDAEKLLSDPEIIVHEEVD